MDPPQNSSNGLVQDCRRSPRSGSFASVWLKTVPGCSLRHFCHLSVINCHKKKHSLLLVCCIIGTTDYNISNIIPSPPISYHGQGMLIICQSRTRWTHLVVNHDDGSDQKRTPASDGSGWIPFSGLARRSRETQLRHGTPRPLT